MLVSCHGYHCGHVLFGNCFRDVLLATEGRSKTVIAVVLVVVVVATTSMITLFVFRPRQQQQHHKDHNHLYHHEQHQHRSPLPPDFPCGDKFIISSCLSFKIVPAAGRHSPTSMSVA